MSQPADLAADTDVVALGDGRYRAAATPAWSFVMPSGGVLMTIALRAMRAELADDRLLPVSATAVFATAIAEGPLAIEVTIIRRGNAVCQVRATLRTADSTEPGLEVLATFARARTGPDFLAASPPAVAGPDVAEVVDVERPDGLGRWPFFHQFDVRLAAGAPLSSVAPVVVPDAPPRPARYARWFRYRVPQAPGGVLDPLAIPPIADTMPAAIANRLGPAGPRFYAPSLDLTIHFLEPTRSDWLLVAAYARRVWDGYATCEAELWSDEGRLVAYATQTMILKLLS